MAFDKTTRNRLATFVGKARDLIADEFTQQFQSLYGISDNGTITSIDQLGHLDDIEKDTADLLRERIEYFIKTHPDERDGKKGAVTRLAREQAFTILNRLAAIRMAEKRDLIVESVGKGYQSKGFKVFEQVAGTGLGDTYHRYRRYIICLFDELAVDLGILFDRRSHQGLLFPQETALQELFNLLNAPDLDPLWAEDETIGWIYQYYNDPAERKKMRDESAAPRNSRELAVRNQFFTPRYVVEFLTDNTLGRIWYEMTQGKTRLMDQCRYLVRRPTEIFLKPDEAVPESTTKDDLSQEELLKQSVYIPFRLMKDPRELLMLDPACGSMHFGLYAFDLYEVIYEEAWDIGVELLRHDYPKKEAFLREVPHLIIEHNIHGIDIDPRAVQIAGLSLWLRAQKSWQAQRVPADMRPRIMRSNIVCAEPMPGSPEMLGEFAATLKPPLLSQLVEKVFTQMQLAGEAGSLLKIEEDIAALVAEAKKLWSSPRKAEQTQFDLGLGEKPKQGELPLDVSGISDERFWETAEERIYTALKDYAEQVESGGYQRRLFAEDAARGFAFIDLCRKRYDVVVMNPPFGEPPVGAKVVLLNNFKGQAEDMYCWFVQRGRELCDSGFVGVISSDSFLRYTDYSKYREFLIKDSLLSILFDLGWEVLDNAYVSASTYVINTGYKCNPTFFIDLAAPTDKAIKMLTSIAGLITGISTIDVYAHSLQTFKAMEGSPFCFWFSPQFFHWVKTSSKVRELLIDHGIGAGPHNIFFRLNWEVPYSTKVDATQWPGLVNGGAFAPYYRDDCLCIDWRGSGQLIKAHLDKIYPYLKGNTGIKIQREHVYYKPGLTYGKRSDRYNAQVLPSGMIPSFNGIGLYPKKFESIWLLLGFLNTRFVAYFLNLTCGLHKNSIYIDRIPIPDFDDDDKATISISAEELYKRLRIRTMNEEVSNYYLMPLSISQTESIRLSTTFWRQKDRNDEIELWKLQSLIERKVNSYVSEFNDIEQALIADQGPDPFLINDASESQDKGIDNIPEHVDLICRPLFNRDNGIESTDLFRLSISRNIPLQKACQILNSNGYLDPRELLHESTNVVSWLLGCSFGRWDIRFAIGERQPPELPDPFAPLPVCPPGMLQNAVGLPAEPKDIAVNYPLRISWPGILVNDENHPEDIVARIEDALKLVWKDRWEIIEQEACELLGVRALRDYFHRPAGFFANHLKRYSKSRRQAPIYWPLSSANGSYTLWIYYHRLTDQTLHTALADFVDPKLKTVRTEISALRESGNHRDRLEELLDLERDLSDFHAEIERIIKLPWKPNLNDGVIITASPLWKLFRLPKWQKDLKACWEKLEKGEYDWAHMAYSIWPKRVEEVCKKDRSIAIAHNLEYLCEFTPPKTKSKRKKKGTY